ncbi:MAG: ATP-binding protein [Ignavibacteriae bacterium HGW-Ignavibacteriae-1]|jgi:serine/threonine-protein kinase RsbW|nr:MAG: ATP-binding protein [Ignavibacteriae bacterium HGW-Ignavibacteriae-1]
MSEKIFHSHNTLKSVRHSITEIEPILADLRSKFAIDDTIFYNIMIAVTEAVNNAINHGNKLDPSKDVQFNVEADKDMIYIYVKDEGKGFNPQEIDDCLEPENLLKASGRGVFIIRELMHEVKIRSNSEGTVVEMKYFFK